MMCVQRSSDEVCDPPLCLSVQARMKEVTLLHTAKPEVGTASYM